MITVTAKAFDLAGVLEFEPLPSSSSEGFGRRVSKVATLDGGVSVSDRGFSYGDTTLTYDFTPISLEHTNIARRLVRLHPTVLVSNEYGVFEAIPESFNSTTDINTLTLSIVDKISEE